MPKQTPKLADLAERIAVARRIVAEQQALLEKLRRSGLPTAEAEGALRTYASSLVHLLTRERRMREDAEAKKGESKKKWAGVSQLNGAVFGHRDAK
jgi:hypothetical protein